MKWWTQLLDPLICKQISKFFSPYLTAADDGWSGTNFERPSFKEMIKDIEDGKVKTVIVKDYCAIMGLNQRDLENQGFLA